MAWWGSRGAAVAAALPHAEPSAAAGAAVPAQRVADGRSAADDLVADLFRAEGLRLVNLARWFVDDRTAAEDIVQEAFIRLARSVDRIRDPDRAAAYLRSIVLNLARDHNRRGLVSLRHQPPTEARDPSVEDVVTGNEDRDEVVLALRGLPRRQRDCVVLRYYYEMAVPDVAETLGLSVNSVKTHLKRGLRALESSLEASR